MDQERINKQIFARLSKLEGAVFGRKGRARKRAQRDKSLADHIIALRNNGFFKQPQIAENVNRKLQPTYHCALDRVVTTLGRLEQRKQLRKTTKLIGKRKYIAYVW